MREIIRKILQGEEPLLLEIDDVFERIIRGESIRRILDELLEEVEE